MPLLRHIIVLLHSGGLIKLEKTGNGAFRE